MVKVCCTRRVIFSPIAWMCLICSCAIVTCYFGFYGNYGNFSRKHLHEHAGWQLKDILNGRNIAHGKHRGRTHHDHHGRLPDRKHGPWYEQDNSSFASSQSDYEHEEAEIIEAVTCRLGTRWELNSRYLDRIESVDVRSVEEELFGHTRNHVVLYVDRMRAVLDMIARLPSSRYFHHDGYRRQNEKGLNIGNYTYYAGGHWRPANCEPRWKVAIVVPFRDRYEHLAILLRNLIPLLQLQKLEFRIFVAEQANSIIFNRGMMKNIGYVEATKFGSWDCVIFHDIDQIPMRGANYYGCDGMPRHLCARPEEMGFKPAYELLFGGVVGLTEKQMEESNGYSNFYWGWGGEDDDLLKRLYRRDYKPTRDLREGFYRTLNHTKKTKHELCDEVWCLLDKYSKRMRWDGINNMTLPINHLKLSPLYTHILVDVKKDVWNYGFKPCQKDGHKHSVDDEDADIT